MSRSHRERSRGFTLIELLVVLLIILIVSAVTLPTVLPALEHRQVSESARILQAALSGARDAAIRANAPRGIRLLPDPVFTGENGLPLASNRWVSIEPAPEYSEGRVTLGIPPELVGTLNGTGRLIVHEEKIFLPDSSVNPNYAPTGWYWNIRQGDKIRLGNSGRTYTIAGPMTIGPYNGNPERFINNGPPVTSSINRAGPWEFLYLVNGQDDNGNGYVDESFDGLDNDANLTADPGYNGVDDDGQNGVDDPNELFSGEFEPEQFIGAQLASASFLNQPYTIIRQPVVSPGSREVTLPTGVVIDMTTWDAPNAHLNATTPAPSPPERSRLPIDPFTRTVDILIAPNGQIIPPGAGGSSGEINISSPASSLPFYHFWLAEREDVFPPIRGTITVNVGTGAAVIPRIVPLANTGYTNGITYLLPMPANTPDSSNASVPLTQSTTLQGERRLVTLFTRTGQLTVSDIARDPTPNPNNTAQLLPGSFDPRDANSPFYDAQIGAREVR